MLVRTAFLAMFALLLASGARAADHEHEPACTAAE